MLTILELLAFSWFLFLWIGYSYLCSAKYNNKLCLAQVLHRFRYKWMKRMLSRVNRVADISTIANLEKNSAFFASSCMFIVAGLLGILAASKKSLELLRSFEYLDLGSNTIWHVKLTLLIAIFVYCFFTFTWCMRQYGFCSVLVGAAPMPEEKISEAEKEKIAEQLSAILDLAGRHFNFGLRGFYFSLAALSWFVGSIYFMLMSVVVVLVLYHREFKSSTLTKLKGVDQIL